MDNRDLRMLLRALADLARLRMLQFIARSEETTVTDLTRELRISQPLASWHLRTLRRAGLIKTRRVGREVHCTLAIDRLEELRRALDDLVAGQVELGDLATRAERPGGALVRSPG